MEVRIGKSVIELLDGDITEMDTDAIVNAANAQLQLGGGVAGAIRRKGGPAIQAECNRIGGTFVGGAVITTGGNLNARHVIHAVGPRMGEGDEDEKLRNATVNSLKVADENGLRSCSRRPPTIWTRKRAWSASSSACSGRKATTCLPDSCGERLRAEQSRGDPGGSATWASWRQDAKRMSRPAGPCSDRCHSGTTAFPLTSYPQ